MAPTGPQSAPLVLPVGGGKGGIGKSTLVANLGLALARLEHLTVVVDADLGGSDLHALLGLDNDRPGLGEVLAAGKPGLDQVVYQVLEPRLHFVPGDAMIVGTANPHFQKKRKLLHAIKKLPFEFILLDLGAGTSITTLDFFLTSPLSLLVMQPEQPAVLNAFGFLKSALFRALDRVLRSNAKAAAVLKGFQVRGRGPGSMTVPQLLGELEAAGGEIAALARRAVARWRPKLVLNRVRRLDDFVHAGRLEGWARQDLGLDLEVLGFVPEDDLARDAPGQGRPALDLDPAAPFSRAVAMVALSLAAWAGRPRQWAVAPAPPGSFQEAATAYARLFPPPGESVPTKGELRRRLAELEARLES